MIGRQLGKFEILKLLGEGGMGAVYRARDTELHRTVALKVLTSEPGSESPRRRLLDEARAASSLNHPAIVTIYEIGSVDGLEFIAMELVEGRTLAEIYRDGAVDEPTMKRYAIALAEALVAAHERGIVHRDLKPGNVMIDKRGRLQLLDFGLAKRTPVIDDASSDELPTIRGVEQTAPGTLLGTPAYMSPEQARGRKADARSDLFSLGAILYEGFTGERAFPGESAAEILSSILRDEPAGLSRASSIPEAWVPILAGLLAKDRDRRYAHASALLEDLRQLETEQPSRRGAPFRLVAISMVLASVILLVLWFGQMRKSEQEPPSSRVAASFPTYRFHALTDQPGSRRNPTLSPSGDRIAYVMEDDQGVVQLWVQEVKGGQPRQLTEAKRDVSRPFWSSADDRLLYDVAGRGIWEISPDGGAARQLVDEGRAAVVSPDGQRIAFNRRRQPWIAQRNGGDPRPVPGFETSFFGGFVLPTFSPDSLHVAFFWPHANRPFGDLWRVHLEDGESQQLTFMEFLSWSTRPEWSADGRWIVFTADATGNASLWAIAADGGEPQALTRGAGGDFSPTLSRDQAVLAYANGRNTGRVLVVDPETGQERVAHERRDLLIGPDLCSDGERITYFGRTQEGMHLFVANLETGESRPLTEGPDRLDIHPTWSFDCEWIYYYQQKPTVSFRRIRADGTGDESVIDDWIWTYQLQTHISPDQEHVVYTVRDAGTLVETRVRRLQDGREWSLSKAFSDARWTRDGSSIYGTTWRPFELNLCPAEGGSCEVLADAWGARLPGDGNAFYLLRGSPPQVWRLDRTSGEEAMLHVIENYDAVDFGWGITPDGQIVHHEQLHNDREIWIGELE